MQKITAVTHDKVTIKDSFWSARLEVNRSVTLKAEYDQLKKTGRFDAFKLAWKPGQPLKPHYFWDSDVAKWIEAVSYSLAQHPDSKLSALLDELIDDIEKAQLPDGYLNVYFTIVEPEKRWKNLRDHHELYCMGHLIEAAVAHQQATGSSKFLNVMRRCADKIDSVFGPESGKKRGYCGHPEIELALMKLYQASGEKRYLKLAKFFIDERGQEPFYFDLEAKERGEVPPGPLSQLQSDKPLREMDAASGHAVRAAYLYAGMADVAAETGDKELRNACLRLWENITLRQMYISGGIGSNPHGEKFGGDYDLPNDTAYAETCAGIALAFWAHRMLSLDSPKACYMDVFERALYNTILGGVSLDGTRYYYGNPLASVPERERKAHLSQERQEWFCCACCPPNLARLLASLGGYLCSQTKDCAWLHLYMGSEISLRLAGTQLLIEQRTDYPWDGKVSINVSPEKAANFSLAFRIPGWCRSFKAKLNGKGIGVKKLLRDGYLYISRKWEPGDCIELDFAMPIERMEAHPALSYDCGRIALQRGPLLYCLEEMDNGKHLNDLIIDHSVELKASFEKKLLGGAVSISGTAWRRDERRWKDALYLPLGTKIKQVKFKAIPFFLRANRHVGEMLVWISHDVKPG
ncbi:MAG: hypothetical protein A2X49_12155 [Lentisphaerae bacterium GWF2_52_8]|nr:MAG: hypothetical protein A2X49_12155 [Lentisphaerae bacterium GWF2_52_8]